MSQVPAWFERNFESSFPLELLPNLKARLRGTPARLEEVLRGAPAAMRVRRVDDKWSIQEQAGHLLDLEPLWLARVEDFTGNGVELTPTDITNRKTDEANHNARSAEEILSGFRGLRELLLQRLDSLDPAAYTRTRLHPRLKTPMRLADHLHFVAEHDDHHLARIWEILGLGE